MPDAAVGPNLFTCSECGYAAEVGAGDGWTLCPECGGNQVTLSRPGDAPTATTEETDIALEREEYD